MDDTKFILIFVLPAIIGGVMVIFLEQPYPTPFNIFLDLGYILYYKIITFVYYKFLKDFRKSYRAMLCCKSNANDTRNTANNSRSLRSLSSSVQTASTQYNWPYSNVLVHPWRKSLVGELPFNQVFRKEILWWAWMHPFVALKCLIATEHCV